METKVDKMVDTFTKWQSQLFSVLGDMSLEEKSEVIKFALEKAMGEAIGFSKFQQYFNTTNALLEPFIVELQKQFDEFVVMEQEAENNFSIKGKIIFI